MGKAIGKIGFGKVSFISTVSCGDGTPGNPVRLPYIIAGRLNMDFSTSVTYSLTEGRFDVNLARGSNQFGVIQ